MKGIVFLEKERKIRFLAATQRQPLRLTGVEAGLEKERLEVITDLNQKHCGSIFGSAGWKHGFWQVGRKEDGREDSRNYFFPDLKSSWYTPRTQPSGNKYFPGTLFYN